MSRRMAKLIKLQKMVGKMLVKEFGTKSRSGKELSTELALKEVKIALMKAEVKKLEKVVRRLELEAKMVQKKLELEVEIEKEMKEIAGVLKKAKKQA